MHSNNIREYAYKSYQSMIALNDRRIKVDYRTLQ